MTHKYFAMLQITKITILFLATYLTFVAAPGVNSDERMFLRSDPGSLFDWIKSGKLYWKETGPKKGEYIYISEKGYRISIANSIANVSFVLENELKEEPAFSFIYHNIPDIIVTFVAPNNWHLISDEYVAARRNVPGMIWKQYASEATLSASSAVINKYMNRSAPKIEGDSWVIQFHVATDKGAIEKWSVLGKRSPFSISSISQIILEKDYSIIPIPKF